MKKIFVLAALPVFFASFVANAQTSMVGATAAGSGVGVGGSAIVSPGPIISPEPIVPPSNGGFVQFNNLTVQSVSSVNVPAEVVATLPGVFDPAARTQSEAVPGFTGTCLKFNSEGDNSGAQAPCPMPPQPQPNQPYSYRIEVGSSTQLMLRDRTQASLSDFSQGDQINVFGYYNSDGSIQAYLVRDISKPVVTQTEQLNNVVLVSVSSTGTSATLAVTQQIGNPCYGFENDQEAPMVCPYGVSSFSANPSTANVAAPQSMVPIWNMLHKYVVNADSRTVILDRNRTQLSLGNLNLGDTLNIYGETSDNGQTVTADIIRDLSIPATPSTYRGTVTQVNADGSFVIQTSNGQTYTVSGPITVGASVTVTGLLSSSTISQVSQLSIGNGETTPPFPVPMMRTQGSSYPTSTNGGPINY